MTAARRAGWNFGLDRALEHAKALNKPLVILEALRIGYRWASVRFHRFVVDGMLYNRRAFAGAPVTYHAYVEPTPDQGKGLVLALSAKAALVVSDDYPCFFLPQMMKSVALRLPVLLELVDSNGLLPLVAAERPFSRAFDFRRFLQKTLPQHLHEAPAAEPLKGLVLPRYTLPRTITDRWPSISEAPNLSAFRIDQEVGAVEIQGGTGPAEARLRQFLQRDLSRYGELRSHPDEDCASGLSPWLHFGQMSVHQVFASVTQHDRWSPESLSSKVTGQREGWWGLSAAPESFVDELITWREIGFNACQYLPNYDRFESLPDWAKEQLEAHRSDPRPYAYDLERLEIARTHDPVWNAAQRQLVREGKMHNYLRMLWGKKILEWSPTPELALDAMIHLNNKYALDGRDPNSYAGIFWVLGRYDRPWAPKRPIYGSLRYMSSDNTVKKLRMKRYLERWGDQARLW